MKAQTEPIASSSLAELGHGVSRRMWREFGEESLYPLLALAISVLAALPLFMGAGILNTRAGGDSPFLVQRVHQLAQSLRGGTFPARWMPDGAYGLGYPFFDFYAALPYYIAALLHLAGCGLLWAIKLTQLLGFLIAGMAMYGLTRKMGANRAGALLASAVYTAAPFHLANVYVRGDSLSEFYAFALYPLILWAVLKVKERPSVEHVAWLAVSYALLIVCHNISAMLFTPLVGLWLVGEAVSHPGQGRWRRLGIGSMALALGLILSAWYWVPAIRERSLVQLQDQTTGYFYFAEHFRTVDLVQWNPVHDYTLDARHNPFSMGLVQGVLALVGLAILAVRAVRKEKLSAGQVVAAFSFLVYTWLITPSSRWIWEHVPLLPYAQFPWRLLSVQALTVGLLVTNIADLWPMRREQAAGLALLTACFGLFGLRLDFLPLTEADITPQRLMLYETYSGNIGTTIRHEYLPKEMLPRPFVSGVQLNDGEKPAPLALEGGLSRAQLIKRTPSSETWELETVAPSLLAFHTTFYPGWEATVDGQAQGVEPLKGLGLVGLRLSPGAHRVELRLERTPVRRYTLWVSALGLLVWLVLVLYPCRRSARYRQGAVIVVIVLMAFILQILVAPEPSVEAAPPKGPLVMDFDRAPYLHEEPGGIFFGANRLLDYTLSASEIRPGEALEVTFHWRWAKGAQVKVELVGATAHLFSPSPVWVQATADITVAYTTLKLLLPEDIPPGLYVPRLSVLQDGKLQNVYASNGMPMGTPALSPVKVTTGRRATGQEVALGHFGPEWALPVIDLVSVKTAWLEKRLLEVTLTWRTQRQAPLNYMLSLRLNRPDGSQLTSRDLPPLLGGYPTSLWVPGELVTDRVILVLPDDAAPGSGYQLEVVLYDRMTLKAMGTVTVEGISVP